ncbi:MAG: hypothetical protein Kow00121_02500 [Elainellaceae cyanobacterium]
MSVDQATIQNYVVLFEEILSKHHIHASKADLANIYQLVLLTFKLDDYYDSSHGFNQPRELETIQQSMITLMPCQDEIAINAIEQLFQGMVAEKQLDFSQSFQQYLQVGSKSIGAQLISGYLASKDGISPKVWFSKTITQLNYEVNCLIRLANDYLDVTVDKTRTKHETRQIKAVHFFRDRFRFKTELMSRYVIHKTHYYICLVLFWFLKVAFQSKEHLGAIHCLESALDWAVKVYMVDKASCQT